MAPKEKENITPDVAGKRLQAQLDVLCPNLKPTPHPRGYPVNRDEMEQLCEDESQRDRLQQAIEKAGQVDCPICERMPLNPESTGLAVQWNVDLARLEWTLARTTPACLHCCMSSNTDSLLNAALAVSDAAGEAALDGVSSHFLAANGHAQDGGELLQAALNLAHSVKVLASNLPCRVVNDGKVLEADAVPALCIQRLEAAAGAGVGGGARRKTPKAKAASVSKVEGAARAGASAAKKRKKEEEEGGEESDRLTPKSGTGRGEGHTPARDAQNHAKQAKTPASAKGRAIKTPRSSKRGTAQ